MRYSTPLALIVILAEASYVAAASLRGVTRKMEEVNTFPDVLDVADADADAEDWDEESIPEEAIDMFVDKAVIPDSIVADISMVGETVAENIMGGEDDFLSEELDPAMLSKLDLLTQGHGSKINALPIINAPAFVDQSLDSLLVSDVEDEEDWSLVDVTSKGKTKKHSKKSKKSSKGKKTSKGKIPPCFQSTDPSIFPSGDYVHCNLERIFLDDNGEAVITQDKYPVEGDYVTIISLSSHMEASQLVGNTTVNWVGSVSVIDPTIAYWTNGDSQMQCKWDTHKQHSLCEGMSVSVVDGTKSWERFISTQGECPVCFDENDISAYPR